MKKIASMIAVAVLCVAAQAHAEHKLLPTDVLDQKQMDFKYDFTYDYQKDLGIHTTDSAFKAGIGLGYGIDVHAGIGYAHGGFGAGNDSFSDMTLGIKYKQDLVKLPVDLVIGLDTTLNTTGTNDKTFQNFTPSVAVGKKMGALNPYATFAAAIDRADAVPEIYTTKVGAEYSIDKKLSVEGAGSWQAIGKTAGNERLDNYNLDANVKYEIAKNLYVAPKLGVQFIDMGAGADYKTALNTGATVYFKW